MIDAISILQQCYIQYFQKTQVSNENMIDTQLNYFNLNYIIYAYLNFLKKEKKVIPLNLSIKRLLKEEYITIDVYDYLIDKIELIESTIINQLDLNIFIGLDLGKLYETQLSFPLLWREHQFIFEKTKHRRDTTGSYYTPKKLAISNMRHMLDSYIEKELDIIKFSYRQDISEVEYSKVTSLLLQVSFIDLSCGNGDFYFAIIDYYERYLNSSNLLWNSFYGIDVDPIALLCCISKLSLYFDIPFKTINKNFQLGNALINNNNTSISNKHKLFSCNRIYSLDYGIDYDMLYKEQFTFIVGNPPWEKIRFEEKKFFNMYDKGISNISSKSERLIEIKKLETTSQSLFNLYKCLKEDFSKFKKYIKSSSIFIHSVNGELNTYSLFLELSIVIQSKKGFTSLILKSGIVTTAINSKFIKYLLDEGKLNTLIMYDNKNKIFDIDSREKFCVLLSSYSNNDFQISFGNYEIKDYDRLEFTYLNPELLSILNPKTFLIPNVQNNEELFLLIDIHKNNPAFYQVFPNVKFGRIAHLTIHANFISRNKKENYIPIFEGKFIQKYSIDPQNYKFPNYYIEKSFWEKISKNYSSDFSLCWRSLTSATNTNTVIATIIPKVPTCQSIQLLQTEDINDLLYLLGLFNSTIFDSLVRLKLSGIDLTQSIINQIPIPSKVKIDSEILYDDVYCSIKNHIIQRVLYLLREDPLLSELRVSYNNSTFKNALNEINDLVYLGYNL